MLLFGFAIPMEIDKKGMDAFIMEIRARRALHEKHSNNRNPSLADNFKIDENDETAHPPKQARDNSQRENRKYGLPYHIFAQLTQTNTQNAVHINRPPPPSAVRINTTVMPILNVDPEKA